jgi:hypothetical protein
VDEYGFERPHNFDYETYEDFMSEYLKVLAKMAKKWAKIIGEGKSLQRSITIKKYVRKGIPGEHRGLVITYIIKSNLFYILYIFKRCKNIKLHNRYGLL